MTQQIAVSKSGKNVLTATDPNDFIFHSSYNSFKIVAKGTQNKVVALGANTDSVAHNQGTRRGFLVFFKINSLDQTHTIRNDYITSFTDPFTYSDWFFDAYNTANTLYFKITAPSIDTIYMSWYLFEIPS